MYITRDLTRAMGHLAVALAAVFGSSASRAHATTILSSGHVDIFEAEYEVAGETPTLHLGVHNDDGHYEPGDVILEVKNAAYTSTSGLPTGITNILGADAWILPADLETAAALGVLEAGIGRVGEFPDSSAVTFTLLSAGASNPGNFVLFTGANAIRLSALGSTVGTSAFTLTAAHLHWNWGFSAPGTYTFDMQASYTDPTFGLLQSPVETYTFQVQPVPEPGTAALAGIALLGVLACRRATGSARRRCGCP
jgi:surface-anchored protein